MSLPYRAPATAVPTEIDRGQRRRSQSRRRRTEGEMTVGILKFYSQKSKFMAKLTSYLWSVGGAKKKNEESNPQPSHR